MTITMDAEALAEAIEAGRAALAAAADALPDDPTETVLAGEVGRRQFTAAYVGRCLAAAGGRPVTLTIDSPGGSASEAHAIREQIEQYQARGPRATVTGVVNGECSSAASLVLQACARRRVGPNARLTVHDPRMPLRNGGCASAADLFDAAWCDELAGVPLVAELSTFARRVVMQTFPRYLAAQAFDVLCAEVERDVSVYAKRSGRPDGQWRAAMARETTYGAHAAVLAGLADEVG